MSKDTDHRNEAAHTIAAPGNEETTSVPRPATTEMERVLKMAPVRMIATGELLVATHLPFPSTGRVAVDGDAFRWVPINWDY